MVWNEHFIKWQPYGETSDKTGEHSLSPHEDAPQTTWETYSLLDPADTENHDDQSDVETAPLRSESYLLQMLQEICHMKSWSGTASEKICPAGCDAKPPFFLTSWRRMTPRRISPCGFFAYRFVSKLSEWGHSRHR